MKNIKELFSSNRIFKYVVLFLFIIIVAFIILVIVRSFHFSNEQKIENQILKIHSTKITIDDVMGINLPNNNMIDDQSIPGIDSNKNNIRDDVELSVFREYPNSAKTRAVLLQYAMSLQMETMQPFLDEKIVTEIVTEQGRTDTCLSDTLVPRKNLESGRDYSDIEEIYKYINFIESKQFNTVPRYEAHKSFYEYLRSYGESNNKTCDIDLGKLPN